MSQISTNQLNTSALYNLLQAEEIQPGDDASYQLCKTIYAYHPLGGKLVDFPIAMAQSAQRRIAVPKGPEERLVEAFNKEWAAINADKVIADLCSTSRRYGVASVALIVDGVPTDRPVDYRQLSDAKLGFNVLDPLNTAGSLVLDQNPNAIDFMKVKDIVVQGKTYHRSRTVTLLNEAPIYIEYTNSAFGYVGRSVYQRALFPLKTFVSTMITDDMIVTKAGVLVAKMKQQSSAIDQVMSFIQGQKRQVLKEARTGNVISIGEDEFIESIDLKNLEAPYTLARTNVIENIASASGTPAKIILAETFAEGFGEGTEDAKHIAQYISRMREWMEPAYAFFTKIVQYRAWNAEFYKTLQNDFPDLKGVGYTKAFYDWCNSFAAEWPSLLEEPESEKVKVADVQLKAVIAMLEVLMPSVDPTNKSLLIQWACDNFNSLKLLFTSPLTLDFEQLEQHLEEEAEAAKDLREAAKKAGEEDEEVEGVNKTPKPPKPFSDSASMVRLTEAVSRLPERKTRKA